jgi:hypothetical protein
MSTPFTFRPAKRENTPLIVGIAGPTKSGKTMSALRLAAGLTDDYERIAMLNAEGARGEQYADWFEGKYKKKYMNCNIDAPYSPERYTEALLSMKAMRPTVGIIDSASHMHDGPGGLLEYHEAELKRMSRDDESKRDKYNFTAWIKPKAAENKFIYTMLAMECPIILCFRAKEKLKIVPGRAPIDLGWQPIAGDRITFETIFTLVLPPHSKGIPDLEQSEMRQPFDTMVPKDKPIDEELGRKLTEWAKGGATAIQAAESDIPASERPLCKPCSAEAKDEIFMQFAPAGKTSDGREFAAFWLCPKKIKDHPKVWHADAIAAWKEREGAA